MSYSQMDYISIRCAKYLIVKMVNNSFLLMFPWGDLVVYEKINIVQPELPLKLNNNKLGIMPMASVYKWGFHIFFCFN